MKISIDWIKDYVNIPDISDKELSEKFTLATCEVEGVERTGELLNSIYIVEVLEKKQHPDSDHLNLVTFRVKGDDIRQVVCGAPNVEIGIKVPYAPIGTTFPDGFTLVPKTIRGIVSEGMLCSEVELAVGDDDSGLMILNSDAPIGIKLGEYLNIKHNLLLDIDNKSITHRPDLWGHYGMAREFSAVFGNPLKDSFGPHWVDEMKSHFTNDKAPVTVEVKPNTNCLGYRGISIDGVKVEESPLWLRQRLQECELRPINNIVDISNYVMLELGMPNHIFDRDTITDGKIIVRTAEQDQKFITLDSEERDLLATDTVVCDTKKPLVIAGIMGGLESGVTENTTKIFIEAANWQDAEVRKTSTRLGLRTDSSQRFEKCLDTTLTERTVLRIVELVLQLCPGSKVIGDIQSGGIVKKDELVIDISVSHINRILGEELSSDRITSILHSLDFKVKGVGENLQVTVPSYRATKDVEFECDIIEEIGRIIGYDNIIPVSPLNETATVRLSPAKVLQRKIQDILVLQGKALEVMTSPLIGKKLLEKAEWSVLNEELILVNAMSSERERMRPSLIPSILEAVELNQKTYTRFGMFEHGRSYLEDCKNFSEERTQVILAYYDRKESRFMEARNTFENMMSFTKIPYQIDTPNKNFQSPLFPENWKGLHPNEQLDIKVMGKIAGSIFTVHPIILRNYKIKGNLAIAVLDLTEVEKREVKDKTSYSPLAKFPSSTFDCTVSADSKTPAIDVINAAKKLKLKEMISVKIVDIFTPENSEKKGVTIRAVFHDKDKTLTGEFLKEAEDKLLATLEKEGFPLKI
ncbi:MAG: phenylalanine--tRNA ligase subunit beta [Spirochaetales bacterium]|nr:phenylalanine--tRNA ligase subunit beta [Spirochaetales bacterium]